VPLHPERPATLVAVNGDALDIRHLDGTTGTTTVAAPDLLADVLAHDDLCRLHGQALLLVNTHYRVLGIATGPAAPPSRLEVMWASRLENGAVVGLLSGNTEQPAWQTLSITGHSRTGQPEHSSAVHGPAALGKEHPAA
jgi:hypothetical protein